MSPATRHPPRKKLPKRLAVIDADNCTGCEACVEICPVACIELRTVDQGVKGTQSWCEVDGDRCIGCELCIRIPRRKSEPYQMLVCPWDAIEMVPPDRLPAVIARCAAENELRFLAPGLAPGVGRLMHQFS
jgi:Na+-translocating ferredoxin:NAD+ oxidoreductase subunit B